MNKTEDQVRSIAEKILGFNIVEAGVNQGVGQITTFNQLGFNGVSDKPDGWYLPENQTLPAIILETKSRTLVRTPIVKPRSLFRFMNVPDVAKSTRSWFLVNMVS